MHFKTGTAACVGIWETKSEIKVLDTLRVGGKSGRSCDRRRRRSTGSSSYNAGSPSRVRSCSDYWMCEWSVHGPGKIPKTEKNWPLSSPKLSKASFLPKKRTSPFSFKKWPKSLTFRNFNHEKVHLSGIRALHHLVHKWGKQLVVDTPVTLKMLQFWTLDNEKRSQMKCLVSTNALDSRVSIYLMLVWQNTSVCNKISMQRSFNACANTLCFMMMHHHLLLCCVVAFPTTKDDPQK